MVSELLRSPLHDRHVAAGARFGEFGGWEMPLAYPGEGGGTVAEHTAVRTAVGIFDVGPLGRGWVTGPGARYSLNPVLTNALSPTEPGGAQYPLGCTEPGGAIDD